MVLGGACVDPKRPQSKKMENFKISICVPLGADNANETTMLNVDDNILRAPWMVSGYCIDEKSYGKQK